MKYSFQVVVAILFLFVSIENANAISFSTAKKQVASIYLNNQQAFYSGCEYYAQGKKLVPDHDTCGFVPRKSASRAARIEWEHVMPAWHFGHQRQCWQQGGRKYCTRYDPLFKKMESDLHNLVPTIGEINGDRSNFQYNMIPGENRVYGNVDAEVDFREKVFEPAKEVRGDIARTYFYMRDEYKLRISRKQTRLFHIWNKSDPVDHWERERNWHIQSVQGNANTYISDAYSTDFKCNSEKRYCSSMSSCDEAKFYLYQCGRIYMDGNNDGIPCNNLCR